jgi:hypothetical protein
MRRVCYHAAIGAINLKVQALKDSLSDSNFGAQDQCLFGCTAVNEVKADHFCDVNILSHIIGVSCSCFAHHGQTQVLDYMNWQHGADCSGINQRIGLVAANLIRRQ